jgi:hypothetical protein
MTSFVRHRERQHPAGVLANRNHETRRQDAGAPSKGGGRKVRRVSILILQKGTKGTEVMNDACTFVFFVGFCGSPVLPSNLQHLLIFRHEHFGPGLHLTEGFGVHLKINEEFA